MAWRLQDRRRRDVTRSVRCPRSRRHDELERMMMHTEFRRKRTCARSVALPLLAMLVGLLTPAAVAQAAPQQGAPLPNPQPPPAAGGAPLPYPSTPAPAYPPQELDRVVSPIALYPDPLLAQIRRPRRLRQRFRTRRGGPIDTTISRLTPCPRRLPQISCHGSRACRHCCPFHRCST
jgi:hypothetical protein